MRFRILGPLAVEADGAPVRLGGPKPRALLAALLVDPGAVVSADRLAEALWGGHPPPGALPAYVSRLRGAFGPDGARLRYVAPGYVLAVADGELDAAEFAQLVAAARRAAAAHDHDGAVALFDSALRLWHGDALAEFADLDFARAEAGRLEELRVAATEERLAALLDAGRDAEAVPDLEAVVDRFPTRERPAVLLMGALYRAGRQADALARYHELRRRLDEEMGVEPSEAAQSLYHQVLDHDPALAPARTPGNLPRRPTSFVGRDAAVTAVSAALRDGPLVTLLGVGGVGKSRLSIEVATRLRGSYPDGAWLCELGPLADDGAVGHAVAVALGLQQPRGPGIEDAVIDYLRRRHGLLLVLDNCEHVLDAAARLVAGIVAHCPAVTVLATSREALGVAGEQLWPVPPLPAADAAALFVARARAARPDFTAGGEAARVVDEICARLDGLPLAVELAAARMRAMTAAEVAQRLDRAAFLSGGPRETAPRHQSLAAAIDWSYQLMSDPERELFARLSVFAGSFAVDAVHQVCADPRRTEDDTLDLLTGLVDKSIVSVVPGPAGTRYLLLETLRAYARDRLAESGSAARFARRHTHHFTGLAERSAQALQGPAEAAWVERVLPDHDNLRVAFERAHAERDDLAVRLVASLIELDHLRLGYESVLWAERAVEIARDGHPLLPAVIGYAARGAWNRGDFGRARALALRAEGRVPRRGTGRPGYPADVLADVALYEGDVDAALRHYEAEVARARADDDPVRLAWTLYYVAVCHAVRRRPHLGRDAAQESLRVAERMANPTARSMARYALGLVLKKAEPDRALTLFDEAVELAVSVRNFWWQGIALMEAAETRAVHGDAATAARAFVDVLDHWARVGDWSQQWLNLRYVLRLLVRMGAEEDAVVLHHCLVAAGRPSPLDPVRLASLLDGPDGPRFAAAAARGRDLAGTDAVALARAGLLGRAGLPV